MKFINLEMLQYFKTKLEELFVKKENKTGSTTEYKVLSDNNLTDELLQKINDAGTSSFNGSYTALTDKPSINGHEIDGEMTLENLGINNVSAFTNDVKYQTEDEVAATAATAKTEAVGEAKTYTDEQVTAAKTELNTAIATATDDMATQTWATEQITTATTDMATNASVDEKIAEAKAYADTAEADAIATAKTYTDEQVATAKTYADEQVAAAKTELQTEINTKISTAYKIKGSTTFANLPALSEAEEGHVYNVTDAFASTADFVEGASKKYPAGTNVVCIEESEGVFKWDVLAGFIDTDVFVKAEDIETVTTEEIDALFAA